MTITRHYTGNLRCDEHTIRVPLTENPNDTRTIDVFARVATREGGENLPYLLFLQGGPGAEAERPYLDPVTPVWLGTALEHYRVVMLDQRGTGRSTPVTDALTEKDPLDAAEYLTHFRADAIVRDAEALREHLGAKTWNTLGQSFGGFTTLHYLSRHPEALDRIYITGGLCAIDRSAEEIYSLCYDKMRARSQWYYRKFPEHQDSIRRLIDHASEGKIVLPDGEVVSPSRLRSLGHLLGSDNGWIKLHSLLDFPLESNAFRYDLQHLLPYNGRNPLYYVIHESSYADGVVTNWAAERTIPDDFLDDPTLFTGEHVREDWLNTVPAFQPWAEITKNLAQHRWPKLYNREALLQSEAQGAAAIYVNDAYVPLEYSLETAKLLPGVVLYTSSEYEHSGLRTSGTVVIQKLLDLAMNKKMR